MEEVAKADYVVIIDQGIISASGTPDELKSKYTTDILRLITDRSEVIESVLTLETLEYVYRSGAYEVKIADALTGAKLVQKYQSQFQDFEILKGNMDHVFLNVTGKKIGGPQDEKISGTTLLIITSITFGI